MNAIQTDDSRLSAKSSGWNLFGPLRFSFDRGGQPISLGCRAYFVGAVASVVWSFALPSHAAPRKDPNGLSWGDLAVLPEYCKDANGIVYGDKYFNASPNAGRWEALMGEDFWHVHHYCYALFNLRRSELEPDPQKRRFLLEKVVGDYNYMIRNSSPQMIIMPEILLRMGDVQLLLGNISAGLEAYGRVMQLKPDYWPAYSRWADTLAKVNNRKEALVILERGIANAPQSAELRAQYRALGGSSSKLEAMRASAPAAVAGGAAASASAAAGSAPASAVAPAPAASSSQ